MLTIYVVSDATGETAQRVIGAALVQFEQAPARILRRGGVRTPEQVRAVIAEAAGGPSFVLHTLVSDDLRRVMLAEARQHAVDAMDLMGPVLDRLATHLQLTPQEKPGLFQQLAEARERQIEAVEFAFRHDDGQHPDELDEAEVVLVGVSRTMKTPTTLYLAYRGWFAANVPLVPGLDPPAALERLPREQVFGMMMSPGRLLELRRARARHLGLPEEPYASLPYVRREIRHAQAVCAAQGWREIDVTGKSVEEASREILDLLPRSARGGEAAPA